MIKSSADFASAVKRRITPQFNYTLNSNTVNSSYNVDPRNATSSDLAIRLHTADIYPTKQNPAITDITNDYWFSALQPIPPTAPSTYRPRQWGFTPGANLIWQPKDEKGGITFEALRATADSWDLLRLVIETRKDQLCTQNIDIRIKAVPGEKLKDQRQRQLADPNVQKLKAFFAYPDGINPWRTWLRQILEDALVLDAVAINYVRDKNGKIAALMPLDGGSICRYLTDLGTTPIYPDPAYAQVVYGTPACNFTTKDLLYLMRNPSNTRRYGLGPVEQLLVSIAIGLNRQDFVLKYYSEGNVPEGLVFLPSDLSTDRIRDIQNWFDEVLSGDLGQRRRIRFLPGYGAGDNAKPNIIFPKEKLMFDPLDEYLIRIICYAFSISPQNLLKPMNRASAQSSADVADEEGIIPWKQFVLDMVNQVIAAMGLSDGYEAVWNDPRSVDPEKQARVDNMLAGKLYTINEIREQRGDDPRPEPEADQLGVFSPTGFIPLGQQVINNEMQMTQQQEQHESDMAAADQDLKNAKKPQPKQVAAPQQAAKLLKAADVHEFYGNLSDQDSFLAFDPDTGLIAFKGDIDIEEARKALEESDLVLT